MIKILKYFEIIPSVAHVRQPPILYYNPIRGLSRTFADTHKIIFLCFVYYEKMSAKVRECPRKSTIILVRECPRMSANIRESPRYNFIQADIRGLSRTFADTHKIIFLSFVYYESPRKSGGHFLVDIRGRSRTSADGKSLCESAGH